MTQLVQNRRRSPLWLLIRDVSFSSAATGHLQPLQMSPSVSANLYMRQSAASAMGLLNKWTNWCMMWTLRTQTLRFEDQLLEGVPTQDMLFLMEMQHQDIVELDLDQPNHGEQLKNLKYIATELVRRDERELDLLLGHIISGGQIIVQCGKRQLAKQFILAISNLLPIGCLRINSQAEQYFSPEQHNMLACVQPLSVPLSSNAIWFYVAPEKEDEESLLNCRLEMVRRPEPRVENPKLLQRYKQLLMDDEVHSNLLRATLQSTREEWMSKAKLLYQLEEQRERDSNMPRGDLIRLCKNCTPQDRPVLSFWQQGLSKAYKNHVNNVIEEVGAMRRL